MSLLPALLALAGSPDNAEIHGRYEAVTETEYGIELVLEEGGRAEFLFRSWEAGGTEPEYEERVVGRWSRDGEQVTVSLDARGWVRYRVSPCLTSAQFGAPGCSFGLKPVAATSPEDYGLQQFGLWRATTFGVGR